MTKEQIKICDTSECNYKQKFVDISDQLNDVSKKVFGDGYYAIVTGCQAQANEAIVYDMEEKIKRLEEDNKALNKISKMLLILWLGTLLAFMLKLI